MVYQFMQIIYLPPPCSNGGLHLGHIGGVYLPADIYRRLLKLLTKEQIYSIAGSDENNTYTLKKSIKIDKNIYETADFYSNEIRQALDSLDIGYDSFVRTSSIQHLLTVNDLVSEIRKSPHVEEAPVLQLYLKSKNKFVTDSLVVGNCYNCGSETDAGACENCAILIDHSKLISPKFYLDSEPLELKECQGLKISNSKITSQLIEKIQNSNWNSKIKEVALNWILDEKNSEIILTRIFEYGLPVFDDPSQKLTIPLWFEAVWGYFTGINHITNSEDCLRILNEDKTKFSVFMGQDNLFHFSVSLVLIHIILNIKNIPDNLFVEPFLKLEGQKFSTSRDHAIFAKDIIQYLDSDTIRFGLFPFYGSNEEGASFTLERFKENIAAYLDLIEFVLKQISDSRRIFNFTNKEFIRKWKFSDQSKQLIDLLENGGLNKIHDTLMKNYESLIHSSDSDLTDEAKDKIFYSIMVLMESLCPKFVDRIKSVFGRFRLNTNTAIKYRNLIIENEKKYIKEIKSGMERFSLYYVQKIIK
ncbi:class I tRNA ligase family protein [Leptospira borgpetersenii]|uniref:class I tRNA ligase family protein n=1 Tax=Leptospira borgpetersenii TaxID=174 RepID=UPI000AD098C3|nr:class I tRNA ligase family protein [Leptospira borgpetersenii]